MILIAQQIDQTKHLQNSKRAIEPRIKERKKMKKKETNLNPRAFAPLMLGLPQKH